MEVNVKKSFYEVGDQFNVQGDFPYTIYTLSDPRNGRVRYVGMSVNPVQRLFGHISEAPLKHDDKALWLQDLSESGYRPVLTIIAIIHDKYEALRYEDELIKSLKASCSLVNIGYTGWRDDIPTNFKKK